MFQKCAVIKPKAFQVTCWETIKFRIKVSLQKGFVWFWCDWRTILPDQFMDLMVKVTFNAEFSTFTFWYILWILFVYIW